MVAESASPHHDLAVNEAKDLACALADAEPLLWGGSVLAARASRRLAQWMRSLHPIRRKAHPKADLQLFGAPGLPKLDSALPESA